MPQVHLLLTLFCKSDSCVTQAEGRCVCSMPWAKNTFSLESLLHMFDHEVQDSCFTS